MFLLTLAIAKLSVSSPKSEVEAEKPDQANGLNFLLLLFGFNQFA